MLNRETLEKLKRTLKNDFDESWDNATVRKYWIDKKHSLRFYIALGTAILIMVGLQHISPYNSITNWIFITVVDPSVMLRDMVNNGLASFLFGLDEESEFISQTTTPADFLVGALIFYFFYTLFRSGDPISDEKLILQNHNVKIENEIPKILSSFNDEIRFNCDNSPSNKLPNRCGKCGAPNCGNRLTIGDTKTQLMWNKLIVGIDPQTLHTLMSEHFSCRRMLLIKYSVVYSIVVVLPAYIVLRGYEILTPVDTNFSHGIYWLVFLLLVVLLLNYLCSVRKQKPTGSWKKWQTYVDRFFSSPEYEALHTEYVCHFRNEENTFIQQPQNTNIKPGVYDGREIEVLLLLSKFLKVLVERKLTLSLTRAADESKSLDKHGNTHDLALITNCLVGLSELLSEVHPNVSFRLVLFFPNESILVPTVHYPLEKKAFNYIHDEESVKFLFDINENRSAATQCWITSESISQSGDEIQSFMPNRSRPMESMINYPLMISDQLMEAIEGLNYNVDQKIGVLNVDCDSIDVFNTRNEEMNNKLVGSFGDRIVYETVLAASTTSLRGES